MSKPGEQRDRRAAPNWGLCSTCTNAHEIETKRGTVYVRCRAPGLPKYPRTPVLECPAFRQREPPDGARLPVPDP
jgi:hypothetical protein